MITTKIRTCDNKITVFLCAFYLKFFVSSFIFSSSVHACDKTGTLQDDRDCKKLEGPHPTFPDRVRTSHQPFSLR